MSNKMAYTLIRHVYRPSIQSFFFGVMIGITVGLCMMGFHNGFTVDLSFVKFSISKHAITAEVGNHSWKDSHHKMLNSSIAEKLYDEVKVLCWVLTMPKNHESKAKHVKATWGKRCNYLIFMSTLEDLSLPSIALPVIEDRPNLWGKTKESLKYIYQHYYDKADWFFKADDDTYAIMENMRYMLYYEKTADPVYFGFRLKPFVKQGYMSGGAGYVLSKEALKRFVSDALPDRKKCKQDNTGDEDVEIGKCLEAAGVKAKDTRDKESRSTFFPVFITDFLIPGYIEKSHWLWSYMYYPVQAGMECCSDNIISIHYVDPFTMYLLEYLVYHVRPFGIGYNPTLNGTSLKLINNRHKTIAPHVGSKQTTNRIQNQNEVKQSWDDYD